MDRLILAGHTRAQILLTQIKILRPLFLQSEKLCCYRVYKHYIPFQELRKTIEQSSVLPLQFGYSFESEK